ncbi:MAG: MCP four helix bundle domain-containing protein [Deltaproteobacteria bacterium]|nr:MCP four helix bundle domain-containing protein [Deltaproteobacteria bacterium]
MKLFNANSSGKISVPILVLIVLLSVSVLLVIVTQFKGVHLSLEDYFGVQIKKLELLSRMQINLFKSVEAEKMAVTADTDESSKTFADQSLQKSDALERDRQELGLLIKKDPTEREIDLLKEFDRFWVEFRSIDRELLEFAVKNTNLKAAQLSFTKGREAVKKFEAAMEEAIALPSGKEDLQREGLICKALVAGIKIHDLHAPHIAAVNDEQMDNIEKEIKQNEAVIARALARLTPPIPEKERAALQKAKAAYDELSKVTAQVLDLSRQNTNIKSFELSLGRKRKITAQCDEILKSLEEAVRSRSFKATR